MHGPMYIYILKKIATSRCVRLHGDENAVFPVSVGDLTECIQGCYKVRSLLIPLYTQL